MKNRKMQTWESMRRQGIGGTDISAIIIANKYKSPLDIYNEKKGHAPDFVGNKYTEMGVYLEKTVADIFTSKSNLEVWEPRDFNKLLKKVGINKKDLKFDFYYFKENDKNIIQCKEHPILQGSVDFFYLTENGQIGVLECKTTQNMNFEITPAHYLQTLWYLGITGFDEAHVVYLRRGLEFDMFKLQRDEPFYDMIRGRALDFWNEHIINNTPPPPRLVTDVINNEVFKDTAIAVEASIAKEVIELKSLKEQYKDLESQIKELENNIKVFMNQNEILVDESGEVLATWKESITNRFDSKKFQNDNESLYKSYLKESKTRRFLIK